MNRTQEITIQTVDGPRTVRAAVFGLLALHRSAGWVLEPDWYCITIVPTPDPVQPQFARVVH